MNINSNIINKEKLHLEKNDFIRIKKLRPGMELTCEKGTLWVTQSGDYRDYLLTPGQNMKMKKRGRVLIEALRDVEFKISNPETIRFN